MRKDKDVAVIIEEQTTKRVFGESFENEGGIMSGGSEGGNTEGE
jgi:hypothetical protein